MMEYTEEHNQLLRFFQIYHVLRAYRDGNENEQKLYQGCLVLQEHGYIREVWTQGDMTLFEITEEGKRVELGA